jgi:hypothetical protein
LRNSLRSFLIIISIFILFLFIIFMVNQTVQIAGLAASLHPLAGRLVVWILIAIYIALAGSLFIMFARLPRPLNPPEDINSPEFPEYLEKLAARLSRNTYVREKPLTTRRDLEAALKILDGEANRIIKAQAAMVFVSTAISQSGRLDTFAVLAAQIRMIWQIARLYYQRPALRELLQLYSNVVVTAFVAGELNDLDISQQIEPIVSSVLGASITGSIPGVNVVAGIVTNSLLSGSANAYLTLRVGVIAKQYCGSLLKKEKRLIRKSASVEAARMLSLIVMNSAGNISRIIVNAALKSPGKISRDVLRSTWGKIVGKEKPASEFPGVEK